MKNRRISARNTAVRIGLALSMTLLAALVGAQEKQAKSSHTGTMKEMPRLKEAGVVTVKGDENWDDILGFGTESDMAEMMTQMMVGGSGMEHMRMAAMKPGMKMEEPKKPGVMGMDAQSLPVTVTLAQNPPAPGENTLDVLVADAAGKPVTGLKLMATVAMTSMDMGTERPKATEGKDGHYAIPIKFSMKGPWRVMLMNDGKADKNSAVHTMLDFNVDGKTKWMPPKPATGMKMATETPAVAGWKVLINAAPTAPVVGRNTLDVTLLDSDGKPVTGAKVTGAVEMTSMNMGVNRPKAQEGKDGHYMVPVEFSMKGPWRVTLTVTPPKNKPFTKALDFDVKK